MGSGVLSLAIPIRDVHSGIPEVREANVVGIVSISVLEGRQAVKTVSVACHRFFSDQKQIALNQLADSLGNLCSRQALPMRIAQWLLAS